MQGNLLAVNLPSGTVVDYVVDARNRRIGRKINGVVTHGWLYQGQLRPVAELDAAGNIVSRFVYGARAGAPEYIVKSGVTYRLITDHIGSVRLAVNNTSGAIVQRIDYDAWGQVLTDTNPGFQPFAFAGGIYDSSTGLVRFGVRDYDAVVGRWLSKDPIRFDGGTTDLFEYADSDPVNQSDRFGLKACAANCASEVLGIDDFIDIGLVLAGQPIPGTKRFTTVGASRGTSLAGKVADAVIGDARFAEPWRTIVGGPGTGTPFRIARTLSKARFVARAVPFIGWGLLALDAMNFASCYTDCVAGACPQ